jgi:outer membrane protein OmpA-like peptidoglycan-associated protein
MQRADRWIQVSALSVALLGGAVLMSGTARADEARPNDRTLELGIAAGVFIPDDEHEFYDPNAGPQEPLSSVNPDLLGRIGFFPIAFVGAEAEAGVVFANTDTGGSTPLLALRGSVVAQVPGRVTPFVFAGLGNIWTRSDDMDLGNDRDRVWHAGLGLKYFMSGRLHGRLDGRWYYTNRLRDGMDDNGMVSHWEVTLGAGYTLGGGARETSTEVVIDDPDADGFIGSADSCPEESGVEPDGCPARDADGDGLVPPQDRCPGEAETVNGFEDDDGCPDELPDTDGDGLRGDADKCPTEPEDVDSFEDQDGCPDLDNDKDGVVDTADKCPAEAGVVENRGCPDTDRDKDGVVDRLDNCPDEPGTAANQGCKKKQLVVITQTSLKILDKVFFATNKARILPRSRRLLNNVAQVLQSHPEIEKIRIEGHTDDRGNDAHNKDLSQRRADAVRDYFIERGVAAERLESLGFGEEKPVADNKTGKGRAQNRRVEFNIVDPTAPPEVPATPEPAKPDGGTLPPK